jgi:hypothetical protein
MIVAIVFYIKDFFLLSSCLSEATASAAIARQIGARSNYDAIASVSVP